MNFLVDLLATVDLRKAALRAEAVLISNLKRLRRRAVACDVDRSSSARGMTS